MENPTCDDGIKLSHDQLRKFVESSTWQFAKTMPQTPHEYTLKRNAPDPKLFEQVVVYIRQAGYQAKFGKTIYSYLDIDGWQYWTMGAPVGETILINRARLREGGDAQ